MFWRIVVITSLLLLTLLAKSRQDNPEAGLYEGLDTMSTTELCDYLDFARENVLKLDQSEDFTVKKGQIRIFLKQIEIVESKLGGKENVLCTKGSR